jgi:hypothetical protein
VATPKEIEEATIEVAKEVATEVAIEVVIGPATEETEEVSRKNRRQLPKPKVALALP